MRELTIEEIYKFIGATTFNNYLEVYTEQEIIDWLFEFEFIESKNYQMFIMIKKDKKFNIKESEEIFNKEYSEHYTKTRNGFVLNSFRAR